MTKSWVEHELYGIAFAYGCRINNIRNDTNHGKHYYEHDVVRMLLGS